ncbi:hypothetical protein CP533_6404 [Ophiocordyceps camponoti-saundersi (nom. inval.)]|nr:hypothetical protein CP533_6404 [Ophiocordyceps camponoti-saundersi (nom. inval.)]
MELRSRQTSLGKRAPSSSKPTRNVRRKMAVKNSAVPGNETDSSKHTKSSSRSDSTVSTSLVGGPIPRRGAPSGIEFDLSSVSPASDEDEDEDEDVEDEGVEEGEEGEEGEEAGQGVREEGGKGGEDGEEEDDDEQDDEDDDDDDEEGEEEGEGEGEDEEQEEQEENGGEDNDDDGLVIFQDILNAASQPEQRIQHSAPQQGEPTTTTETAADSDKSHNQGKTQLKLDEILSTLPDLSAEADDLVTALQTDRSSGGLSYRTLKKIEAFRLFFGPFTDQFPSRRPFSPFADWRSFDGDEASQLASVMAKANLVTALYMIHQERVSKHTTKERKQFLEALDLACPELFAAPGRPPIPAPLLLEIRTHYFMHFLACNKARSSPEAIIVRVFCQEKDDNTDPSIKGPYRSLGADDEGLCSTRVDKIMSLIAQGHRSNRDSGISLLCKAFPSVELTAKFHDWAVEELQLIQKGVQQDPEQSSDSESQEIIRHENGPEALRRLKDSNGERRRQTTDESQMEPSQRHGNDPLPSWSRRSLTNSRRTARAQSQDGGSQLQSSAPPIAHGCRPQYTRRLKWSDHDSSMLLQCIKERDGNYAAIEENDQERFETSRNQQAYRDRARNMKVTYLLNDEPLPERFDNVSLGQKEKDRISKAGKNPYRLEKDVDEHGHPINTELRLTEGGGAEGEGQGW